MHHLPLPTTSPSASPLKNSLLLTSPRTGSRLFIATGCTNDWKLILIATKEDTLHFIEVKSLSAAHNVFPEVHLTVKKFASLKKAADQFLLLLVA